MSSSSRWKQGEKNNHFNFFPILNLFFNFHLNQNKIFFFLQIGAISVFWGVFLNLVMFWIIQVKLTCQSRFIRTNPGLCFTIHQTIHTVPFINYKGVKQNFKKHSTSNENQNKVSPKSYVIHITLLLFSVCSFAIPLSPKNYIHFIF